ncbi:MAG TPA: hypothetical protein VM264_04575 [Acidimicrobiales bacterium]|nr:hypothetical protein [Acidimicrobiales bacterium]
MALAAPDVGHPGGWFTRQAFVDFPGRCKPVAELVDERRAVDCALAVTEVGAVPLVRDATAGAVCGHDFRQGGGDADDHRTERGHMVGAVGDGERLDVSGRKREAALAGRVVVALHVEDAGHRLLLEPLLRVAAFDARRRSQPVDRHRPRGGQRHVQAQAPTQVDAQQLERPDRRLEEPLDQGGGGASAVDAVSTACDRPGLGAGRHLGALHIGQSGGAPVGANWPIASKPCRW